MTQMTVNDRQCCQLVSEACIQTLPVLDREMCSFAGEIDSFFKEKMDAICAV